MEVLEGATIVSLREALSSKKISSVELTKQYLARIEQHSDLNAYITVLGDNALASAAQADAAIAAGKSSELLGVPVAVKDLICAQGTRTTCGSRMLENFIAPYDATVVTKLKNAGAVILGKLNMDEFAMGSSNENSYFGPVRNPWKKSHVPGGSSGGSAAAVSASLCAASLGTDTGGSIRLPASFCNLVGIKPTYGRVSRYGVVAYASSLDQVGPLTTTVEDAAIMTSVLSGADERDSTSARIAVPNFQQACKRGVKGLRIGIPKEYFIEGVQPAVKTAVRKAIDALVALGAQEVEISLPHTETALAVYYILAPAECSSNLARYDGIRFGHRAKDTLGLEEVYSKSRSEGFGAEVKRRIMVGTYVLSSGYFDAFYLKAQKVRSLIRRDFENAFRDKCDVIISPVAPTPAFKIGDKATDPVQMYLSDVFTIPVNLAGLPGMSVPCGFDDQQLPIGFQLIGKPFDEETLFATGAAYQAVTQWHAQQPTL